MNIITVNNDNSQKKLSIISFSLFSAWLLAFPFAGQVFFALTEKAKIDAVFLSMMVVFTHFVGLFISGFFIKKQVAAKMAMITAMVVCIAGSLIFFLPFSILWYISMISIAFFAGLYVSSWGFYYKMYSSSDSRLKTAADVLIYSNIIMIIINVITVHTTAFLGLGLAIITLLGALFGTFRLEATSNYKELPKTIEPISGPLIFLCVFILVITINSGLMYQVFNPAFAHFELLTSYYWAVPYIAALMILRNMSGKINIAYIFYIAMAMIGLAYILFMWLDRSVISYLLIDTFMLGAFGVCDLFWWSILGSFLDYSDNPAQVLGIGLSMNVLGIFIGGYMGNVIISLENPYFYTSVIALFIIFLVLIMFPILNNQLIRLLKSHVFLVNFSNMKESEQEETLRRFKESKQLTEKEIDIVKLLLQGYTYKAISENSFISENTVKFHVKNIYQKLNINSKMDLVKIFTTFEPKNNKYL
jgi:DNA-binding CsgD family transcriptional regulator